MKPIKINFPRIILIFLLGILSLSALAGGTALILSTLQGASILPPEYLIDSPFHTAIIPGIILFLFIGVFPTLTIYGLISEKKDQWQEFLNIYHDRHWSFAFSIYSAIILLIWLDFEVLFIGFNILQFIFILLGIFILITALYPRNFYRKNSSR
jgi:hypothetical protein